MIDGFDTHSDAGRAIEAAGAGSRRRLSICSDAAQKRRPRQARGGDDILASSAAACKENGSKGTDHGAASCMFVAGPGVKGGVHGKHPSLSDLDDGDLKYHIDFRRVYATLLENWLGVDSKAVLGAKFEPMEFIAKK